MADGIDLMQQAGFYVRNARRLLLERVEIAGQRGPAIQVTDSSQVEICASTSPTPAAGEPVVRLSNVNEAIIRDCRAVEGTDTFLGLDGAGTRDITLIGNALAHAARPVSVSAEVSFGEVKSA
jgi:hypothetical protein